MGGVPVAVCTLYRPCVLQFDDCIFIGSSSRATRYKHWVEILSEDSRVTVSLN
jgi:hypothetical protein